MMAEETQTRAQKFGDAILWGAGFAVGSLIVGGLMKLAWTAATKKKDPEPEELDSDKYDYDELDEAA